MSSELCVEELDTVDIEFEVRSGADYGLGEEAVLDHFGLALALEGFYLLAVNGKCIGVEDLESTCLELFNCFVKSFLGSCRSSLTVDIAENDGALGNAAAPVGSNSFTLYYAFGNVEQVRSPVDSRRNDECIGAVLNSASVVGNVGNAGSFASVRSTH